MGFHTSPKLVSQVGARNKVYDYRLQFVWEREMALNKALALGDQNPVAVGPCEAIKLMEILLTLPVCTR
jgi:hypothetical protein